VSDPLRPLYTYLDRLDAGDVDAVGDLFTEDAVYSILNIELHGPAEIVKAIKGELSKWERTSHHGTNPLVDVDGDTATVSAGIYAFHQAGETFWKFYGRYTQKLVRRGDGWAITHMNLYGIASEPDGDPAMYSGHPDRRPVVSA
jgi:ketosteroid isomerase-like protein